MKCIRCGTDNKLKDRTANQGRCKNCRHPFVFEPTTMGKYKITDPMFAKAITDLSLDNTLFFTPKQLFYLLDNRLRGKSFTVAGFIFIYIFFSIWTTGFIGSILASFIGDISFITVLAFYNLWCIFYLFNQSKSTKNNNKARRKASRMAIVLGIIIIAGGIFISVSPPISIIKSLVVFTIATGMGSLSIYFGMTQVKKTGINQELLFDRITFQRWLDRWQEINGSIEKLLPSPREQISPVRINPDVTAYSFDRLVVCDSSNIAQILIANNFHFENNCAILSITGYPQSIFEITMQMLRRNPNLQVYALHDCSPRGLSLVNRLRSSPQWFANTNIAIIDIGLTPSQIIATKRGIFIQSTEDSARAAKELPPEIRQSLSNKEIQWLELGNFVELESFTPKRLIQVLNRCILRTNNFADEDNNFVTIDDTSGDMYLVQSFG
ncbi:MAG: hypothetical protein QNJ70_07890 [Xenococcaceae cyanobacterium MO_207.B15]|nr:hypothetical protein [Xenococcaceae cyanobacterium MO_207.B15]